VLIAINTLLEYGVQKMKNVTKLALGVALAAGTSVAGAGTISGGTAQTVSAEMSQGGTLQGRSGEETIAITLGRNFIGGDLLTLTLSGGEFVAGQTLELYTSDPALGPGLSSDFDDFNFFSATATEITFRASGPLDSGRLLYLSGDGVADASDVEISLGAGASGAAVTLSAASTGPNDVYATPATLYSYTGEFSGSVSGAFSAVVDAVNANRLAFESGGSDVIEYAASVANVDITEALTTADKLNITLIGDMSGIGSVLMTDGVDTANATIDAVNGTATLEASASEFFGAAGSTEYASIVVTANGTDVLSPRTFTLTSSLDLDDENFSDPLTAAAAAGAFTMNGAQARVAQLSLNFGFVQWVKVGNLSAQDATIVGDLSYNGTTTSNIPLGTVAGNSVATVGGAALEAALAAAGVTAGTDATLTLTVAANPNDVVFHAEKKDATGRSISDVLTNKDNTLR
jgi:hypothetical protein